MEKQKKTVKKTVEEVSPKEEAPKTEVSLDTIKEKSAELSKDVSGLLNKKFGKFALKQILLIVLCVILVLLVLKALVSNSSSKNEEAPAYSVVYTNDDGDLMVVGSNGKNPIKLSSERTSDVEYANKSDRYILYTKGDSLYLYDKKKKDDIYYHLLNIQMVHQIKLIANTHLLGEIYTNLF